MTRAFWAELVLGAVFAVLAIMFLSGAFTQNKEAQASLTDYAVQTNESIRANVTDSGNPSVSASSVISTISSYCRSGNTTIIEVVIGTLTYGFRSSTTSETALSSSGASATSATVLLADLDDTYTKEVVGNTITYTQN